MADVENLQIEIQAAFCNLSEEKLKDVCSKLNIILPPESKGRLVFIQALNKYLETEKLDCEKLKELLSSLSMEGKVMAPKMKTEPLKTPKRMTPPSKLSKNLQYQFPNLKGTSRSRDILVTCRRTIL